MDDLISRQAAIEAVECIADHHSITPYQTMRAAMDLDTWDNFCSNCGADMRE